jgi:hypothetical protein
MVGGPAKAMNFSRLGQEVKFYQFEATRLGVGVKAVFARGTPASVIKFVSERIGARNVILDFDLD